MTSPSLLSLRNVCRNFGGLAAVQNVSLELPEGIVTALAGPNGAGKTTLFNLVTGHLRPDQGTVELKGKSVLGLHPFEVARLGIARSFQDLRLFGRMTVRDNILAALEPSPWFWQPGGALQRDQRNQVVERVMKETHLERLHDVRAVDLSYAETKFLSLARIIATDAPIWLLDEPASGLDPVSRAHFVRLIRDATARGVTICLIEHNLDIVTELADRIVFLDQGKKLAEGLPAEILSNDELIAIYFGEKRS